MLIIIVFSFLLSCSTKRDGFEVMYAHLGAEDEYGPVIENDIDTKLSVKELIYDLDYLIETIEDVAVDPYTDISKTDFYEQYELVRSQINKPLTRREFYLRIAPLIGLLKHTHTHIWISPEVRKYYDRMNCKSIPLKIKITSSKLYVAENYSMYTISEGKEILSINNIDSKELVENLRRQIKSPTINYANRMIETYFDFLLWWVYDFKGPFNIKFNDAELVLEGKLKSELAALRKSSKKQKKTQKKDLSYQKIMPKIGLLTIRTFGSSRDGYMSFLKESFLNIKNDSIEFLIIDVRDNGGGSDWQGVELIKYIYDKPFKSHSKFYRKKSRQKDQYINQHLKWWVRWIPSIRAQHIEKYFDGDDRKYLQASIGEIVTYEIPNETPEENQIRFNGDVFVLINHNSYSAAAVFATMIKDYQIATLVGSETGQCASADGELLPFHLPNSHWGCFAATTLGVRPNGNKRTNVGIAPDYHVKQTNATDDVFEFTINLIKQKNNLITKYSNK